MKSFFDLDSNAFDLVKVKDQPMFGNSKDYNTIN